MKSREWVQDKARKILVTMEAPGAIAARLSGCYLEFYQMIYRLYAMGIRPRTILDIGANRGMFARCANHVFPEATIHAFEPISYCFSELIKLKDSIPSLHCHNVALGKENMETIIRISRYDYSSSLLEMNDLHKFAFPYTVEEGTENVSVRTLDGIMGKSRTDLPLLMKIDVQGYEMNVLAGSSKILKETDVILCEMSFSSLYKGQALFDDVLEFLRSEGFRFRGQLGELRHPKTQEVLQIDGLFIRKSVGAIE